MAISEYRRIGRIIGKAMAARRAKPKLAALEFINGQFDKAELLKCAPDFKCIFKEAKRIWEANL